MGLPLLLMIIRIDGPLHSIHKEMVANALRQGATKVVVEAAGPQTTSEAARWFGQEVEVVDAGAAPAGQRYFPTIREQIVTTLLKPNAAFATLLLGLLLVYVEFCLPGSVIPGALGGMLSILALYCLSASPLRHAGIALLMLSAILFVATAFWQGRGVLGFCATVSMAMGALLLIESPAPFRIAPLLAVGLTIPFAIITLFLTGLALRARINKLPEQKAAVVFSCSGDIFSTISGKTGKQANGPIAARRT
jgi:membrane-bound ClpP family serine protease